MVLLPDGTRGYEEIIRTATSERLTGTTIIAPVASAGTILHSKEAADRTKDREMLPRLRQALDPLRSREGYEPPGR